jgi:hypothetical protein
LAKAQQPRRLGVAQRHDVGKGPAGDRIAVRLQRHADPPVALFQPEVIVPVDQCLPRRPDKVGIAEPLHLGGHMPGFRMHRPGPGKGLAHHRHHQHPPRHRQHLRKPVFPPQRLVGHQRQVSLDQGADVIRPGTAFAEHLKALGRRAVEAVERDEGVR